MRTNEHRALCAILHAAAGAPPQCISLSEVRRILGAYGIDLTPAPESAGGLHLINGQPAPAAAAYGPTCSGY